MTDIPRATVKELAYKIKGYGNPRFAFFLGAGASRQSGIITAGEMISYFKKSILEQCCPDELKTDEEKEKWLTEQEWYKKKGSEYCKLFEKYEPREIGRQRYIESIIEGHEPSFGYVVLANLMASNYLNTIITTNFDDLVYSACTSYTGIRPIVYAYGVLASEMRITAQRPKILKLHGDYLYSALKNTNSETAIQDANMARQLTQVLNEYGLIVVGYSGGDKSIMKILSTISERNDLYWCVRQDHELNADVKKLLKDKGGFIVEIKGFDEMIDEIRLIVGFDVGKMLGSIQERQDQMIEKLKSFAPQYSTDILSETVVALQEQARQEQEQINKIKSLDFFTKALEAHEARDFGIAEVLYRNAIKLNPVASVYNNLGNVLTEDATRYAEAEAAYRKAIEINPGYAKSYNNLGIVLAKDATRYTEAEAAYRKAIELEPNNAAVYYNLGTVLAKDATRYTEAEAAYRKAIELNPNIATAYNSLVMLLELKNSRVEALSFAERWLQLDAQSLDPLIALATIHKKLGHKTKSNEYTARARELIKPDDWYNLACLESICDNTDAAIENLKRAAQQNSLDLGWVRHDPDLEWIRDDPRFVEIVGREET
jgi:tetratricopeptide (TPR) repeat protein